MNIIIQQKEYIEKSVEDCIANISLTFFDIFESYISTIHFMLHK